MPRIHGLSHAHPGSSSEFERRQRGDELSASDMNGVVREQKQSRESDVVRVAHPRERRRRADARLERVLRSRRCSPLASRLEFACRPVGPDSRGYAAARARKRAPEPSSAPRPWRRHRPTMPRVARTEPLNTSDEPSFRYGSAAWLVKNEALKLVRTSTARRLRSWSRRAVWGSRCQHSRTPHPRLFDARGRAEPGAYDERRGALAGDPVDRQERPEKAAAPRAPGALIAPPLTLRQLQRRRDRICPPMRRGTWARVRSHPPCGNNPAHL